MEYDELLIKERNKIIQENELIKNKIDIKILSNQIKSKKRVTEHGEVLTPSWLVNDMLDMLPKYTEDITTKYMEMAAGEGIFLIEILKRKLEVILRKYDKPKDIEFYTLMAVSNIYGLELLKDNVEIIRVNLAFLVEIYFKEVFKIRFRNKFKRSLEKIIELNIINIDSIQCKVPKFSKDYQIIKDDKGQIQYEEEPAYISEWRFKTNKKKVQRVDYFYRDIVEEQNRKYIEKKLENSESINLNVDELGDINLFNKIDEKREMKKEVKKDKPKRVFKYVEYLDIAEMGEISNEK